MAVITSILAALGAWIEGLSLFWWVLVSMGSGIAVGLIALVLSIVWKKLRSDPPPASSSKSELNQPEVDPTSGWDDRGYHGIFLKNVGDAKAYNVTMKPLQMGKYSIEFTGPEVSQLEPGDTRFLHPNSAPSILLRNFPGGAAIFQMLRSWQMEIGDLEAAAEGRIKYEDRNGVNYETRYTIGADVLNSDGLAVRVVTGS